jgi:hypothetical protein
LSPACAAAMAHGAGSLLILRKVRCHDETHALRTARPLGGVYR